jgi:glycolate oxidase
MTMEAARGARQEAAAPEPAANVAARDELRSLLLAELGDAVRVDADALNAARADKSGHVSPTLPLAVVEATTIEQVQATMRFATAHRIPVVPRGAGTGLAGAAIAGAGELVLSTRGMDRILEISVDDELAVVEPGVINGDLNAVLAERGLWWAPDPASKAISTIGGNIATNAGGLLCVKYGVTREAVLGLKVVLSDGRLLEMGHRTVKGVTGYDLTALMIGSEGTLGIVVEATLKIASLPRGGVATISALFPSVEGAARAAAVIVASGIKPAIMELIDGRALMGIGAYLGLELGGDDGRSAQLLVQTDGTGADTEAGDVLAVIRSLGGMAELTTDRAEGEALFAIRRAFHPAMEARGTVLIEDLSVPRSTLPAMFAAIEAIETKYGIEIPTVAHAGDGNLHPNFVFQGDVIDGHVEVPDDVWAAADELFLACLRLGGTLTGEHGIGILKKRWLRDELGEVSLTLQKELKRVFDPLGILNPGKVF